MEDTSPIEVCPIEGYQDDNRNDEDQSFSDVNEDNKKQKMSGKEHIEQKTREFDEMIEFMDFSFETAF